MRFPPHVIYCELRRDNSLSRPWKRSFLAQSLHSRHQRSALRSPGALQIRQQRHHHSDRRDRGNRPLQARDERKRPPRAPVLAPDRRDARGRRAFQRREAPERRACSPWSSGASHPLPLELQMDKADNRILALAISLKKEQPKRPVVFVTKDTNLRIKADALGITAEDYEPSSVEPEQLYTGTLTLNVDAHMVDEFYQNKRLALQRRHADFQAQPVRHPQGLGEPEPHGDGPLLEGARLHRSALQAGRRALGDFPEERGAGFRDRCAFERRHQARRARRQSRYR